MEITETTVDRDPSKNFYEFQSNGLIAMISPINHDVSMNAAGRHYIAKKGELVCSMHFSITGSDNYIEGTEFASVKSGFRGLKQFLNRIYEPEKFKEEERLPYNIVLISGITNERMAKIAKRLGFRESNNHENIFGEKLGPGEVQLLGTLRDLKEAYDILKVTSLTSI